MYATAHRVRSPSKEGINAFLSFHRGTPDADTINWEETSIQEIAEQRPGILMETDADLRPGGNTVRSYLDIVAADDTDVDQIRAALDTFEKQLETPSLPYSHRINRIGIRFGAAIALDPERIEEFQALKNRLLRLLERRKA